MMERIVYVLMFLTMIRLCTSIVIETKCGPVRGRRVYVESKSVFEFLGIPFAEPPVNELRFCAPKSVKPWNEILDATKQPPGCIQDSSNPSPWVDHESGQSEDCLYLNVYVPSCNGAMPKSRSVVVWIYGGAFVYGSNRNPLYNGKTIAARESVIIVVMNYRLSILGFMTSPREDVPGNAAVYDVHEAMKWTKENIPCFGGDPDSITLAGESSGSIMASLTSTCPAFDGLYNRMILQSGTASVLFFPDVAKSMKLSNQVALNVGCANTLMTLETDPDEVIECMRTIDPLDLVLATDKALKITGQPFVAPQYGDKIVPQNPNESIKTKNFLCRDTLVGCMKNEGTLFTVVTAPELFGYYGEKDFKVTKLYATNLTSFFIKDLPNNQEIIDYYYGGFTVEDDVSNSDAIRANLSKCLGDFIANCPSVYAAEAIVEMGCNVYFYRFDHRQVLTPFAEWMRATHFLDVAISWGMPFRYPKNFTKDERKFSKTIMKLWTKFAKTGIPSNEWIPYDLKEKFFRTLEYKHYCNERDFNSEDTAFWRKYFF